MFEAMCDISSCNVHFSSKASAACRHLQKHSHHGVFKKPPCGHDWLDVLQKHGFLHSGQSKGSAKTNLCRHFSELFVNHICIATLICEKLCATSDIVIPNQWHSGFKKKGPEMVPTTDGAILQTRFSQNRVGVVQWGCKSVGPWRVFQLLAAFQQQAATKVGR